DGVDAQLLDIVELARDPREVADAVIVAVEERADVYFVDDRVLVPKGIAGEGRRLDQGAHLQKIIEIALGAHLAADPEKMRRGASGLEGHEVAGAAPEKACPREKVIHL